MNCSIPARIAAGISTAKWTACAAASAGTPSSTAKASPCASITPPNPTASCYRRRASRGNPDNWTVGLAERILTTRPKRGHLTISNALQWRLQYKRIIDQAGKPRESRIYFMNRDLGDFQTPIPLAEKILSRLSADGRAWTRALEPTCGRGNFIQALLRMPAPPQEIVGLEIQQGHIASPRTLIGTNQETHIDIRLSN